MSDTRFQRFRRRLAWALMPDGDEYGLAFAILHCRGEVSDRVYKNLKSCAPVREEWER